MARAELRLNGLDMHKPLAALLLSAATVAALAVPAGAASSKGWTRVTISCRTGHKSAVFAYSQTHPYWLQDPGNTSAGLKNPNGWLSWYKNPCPGQWLVFSTWNGEPAEGSDTTWNVGTGTAGKVKEFAYPGFTLADAPDCANGPSTNIVTKGQKLNNCPA